MRLVFAGTPRLRESALQALLDAGHDIGLVLTQPDRPSGRGLKLRPSEVKALALERGLRVAQPATLRADEALATLLAAAGAQAMVVAAYGLILPQAVLDLLSLGCINIHASLLPRWRGAAPIQRAILAGDTRYRASASCAWKRAWIPVPCTCSEAIRIGHDDTAGSLHDKLATLGGRCIVRALEGSQADQLACRPQPTEGVTYAHKIEKRKPSSTGPTPPELDRQMRAFNPFPVAQTHAARRRRCGCGERAPCSGAGGYPGRVACSHRCAGSGRVRERRAAHRGVAASRRPAPAGARFPARRLPAGGTQGAGFLGSDRNSAPRCAVQLLEVLRGAASRQCCASAVDTQPSDA